MDSFIILETNCWRQNMTNNPLLTNSSFCEICLKIKTCHQSSEFFEMTGHREFLSIFKINFVWKTISKSYQRFFSPEVRLCCKEGLVKEDPATSPSSSSLISIITLLLCRDCYTSLILNNRRFSFSFSFFFFNFGLLGVELTNMVMNVILCFTPSFYFGFLNPWFTKSFWWQNMQCIN